MKKVLCALLALALLGSAALAEEISLKVWGSQEDQELLAELCEAFAAEHPENEWTFTYGVVGEADAKTRYLEDPAAAADVFSYPDDQIIDLVNADALYEVDARSGRDRRRQHARFHPSRLGQRRTLRLPDDRR